MQGGISWILIAILAVLLAVAAYRDWRSRTISNGLNAAIALLAIPFWWATGLSLWPEVAIQIALPLRHLVYPGAVLWNEDGMRFAWHVMIREKHGSVQFVARFADGKKLEVPASNYLTARQEREMGGQPDLILQLARHIGHDLRARGYRDFTLHAETAVSLNGRRPQAMIDPEVDLLQIDDFGPRTWVLAGP
jgi:hypothetical protein